MKSEQEKLASMGIFSFEWAQEEMQTSPLNLLDACRQSHNGILAPVRHPWGCQSLLSPRPASLYWPQVESEPAVVMGAFCLQWSVPAWGKRKRCYSLPCRTWVVTKPFLWLLPCCMVSWGCCNKVPQTGWFKTREIYCLTVLDARNLKSRCWQAMFPLKPVGDPCSPLPASDSLAIFGASLLEAAQLQSLLSPSLHNFPVCLCLHMAVF